MMMREEDEMRKEANTNLRIAIHIDCVHSHMT